MWEWGTLGNSRTGDGTSASDTVHTCRLLACLGKSQQFGVLLYKEKYPVIVISRYYTGLRIAVVLLPATMKLIPPGRDMYKPMVFPYFII